MQWLESLPDWASWVIFAAGCVVVWRAGTRLSRLADVLTHRTRLGQAFVGALLLGGATSLPEIATTLSASIGGSANIAVNNIFGGIAMQVTILALADWLFRGEALTATFRHPGVLLEGTLLVFVLTIATMGIAIGDVAVLGFGLWSLAIMLLVVAGLILIKQYEEEPQWQPAGLNEKGDGEDAKEVSGQRRRFRQISVRSLVMQTTGASVAVLIGGFAVARSGERIAELTGMGGSFVGAVLIAIATSLPEVSTTFEAARMGARLMAVSNIFGTNLFDSALLFLADVAYPGAPVLNEVGRFAQVGALLGIACTTLYIAGILERRDRTVFRMGLDSLMVLIVYIGGVVLLYTIR